jgi:hypothetical protein
VGDPAQENDFETAMENFLQVAPPKLSNNIRNESHNVSVVGADRNTYTIAAVGTARGNNTNMGKRGYQPATIGKTGIELRYYKRHIFNKLRDDQKEELRAWRIKHEAE